jgi:hypothetical protein
MKSRNLGLLGWIALLTFGESAPVNAQFMTNYPAIIITPPPAQNLVVPKPSPKPVAPSQLSTPPPDPSAQDSSQCSYQGRVKTCH